MKKTALALTIIVVFLVPSMANAQTTSYYSPDVNGTNYYLEIYSPNNQTAYNQTMLLNFYLQWHWDLMPLAALDGDYAYSIDDNPFVSIESNQTANDRYASAPSENFKYDPSFSYSLGTSNLTSGYHKIVIAAQLHWDLGLLYNQSSSPVFFSVQNLNPALTPTPSPEPTPKPETFPTTLAIVSVIAVVAVVAIGLLVYFKKRRRNKNLSTLDLLSARYEGLGKTRLVCLLPSLFRSPLRERVWSR
jgi:hypothetical protein